MKRPGPTGREERRERLVRLLNRLSVPLAMAEADREERRRMTAAALFAAGIRPAEVARLVDLAFPPGSEAPFQG
jgi:hypothetical protein